MFRELLAASTFSRVTWRKRVCRGRLNAVPAGHCLQLAA